MNEYIYQDLENILRQAYIYRIGARSKIFPPDIHKLEAIDITVWLDERFNIQLGSKFIHKLANKKINECIEILYACLNI